MTKYVVMVNEGYFTEPLTKIEAMRYARNMSHLGNKVMWMSELKANRMREQIEVAQQII